jgi:hypothetical protein
LDVAQNGAQFFSDIKSKAGGREEFRENRKQLRCCNWIQLSKMTNRRQRR